jgi:IS5 family transposase
MLRMYIAQQCFGLSDEGTEDALYDSQAIHHFVGIDLNRETAPDATTLLKFRRLLEAHQLTESIFNEINAHLAEKGLFLREGTIVDATLIAAPPSTKNEEGKRDGRDAPNQERQPVAFRHESAHRRGCAIGTDAYPRGYGG